MDSYWDQEAIEARKASVGAVFDIPRRPKGLREKWRLRKRLRRAYAIRKSENPLHTHWREYREAYWQGYIDLTTGRYVKAYREMSMAAIGGPLYVSGNAMEVDNMLSNLVSQPTMPDGSPWEDGRGALINGEVAAMQEP